METAPSVTTDGLVPNLGPLPAEFRHEVIIQGRIIDSWVEPAGTCNWDSRLVLQVTPRGRPCELLLLEANATLVPDLGWLADLSENLCHGMPVTVRARSTAPETFEVAELRLER